MNQDPAADFDSTVELVGAAKRGDQQAVDTLFTRYLPRVRQIVALRMGRKLTQFVDHDDIVQETLLKVFQGLDRFEQKTEGGFRNWLARCVECEITDQARKAEAKKRGGGKVRRFGDQSSDVLVSSIFAADGASPSELAQAADTEALIETALLDMAKHFREVIILRYLCEMSYGEVAESMGFAQEATARKACSRALQKLREVMGGDVGW